MTLIEQLEQQARIRPDQTALLSPGYNYSYREFDALTTKAAHALMAAGVAPGAAVGISYGHDVRVALSVLAVAKAGAAYVPINTKLPPARQQFIKDSAHISLVLGQDADIFALARAGAEKKGGLPRVTDTDRLAIMYTSGSTGQPKGVVLLHKNPLVAAEGYNRIMGIEAGLNMASYVSLSFIVALNDIAVALQAGAVCVYVPEGIRLSIRSVADFFNEHKIVSALLPAAFGRRLADGAKMPQLKSMGLCGEHFIAPGPTSFPVYNVYGTTEICGAQFVGPHALMPISVRAEVVDGEMLVSGDSVAEGYLGGPPFNGQFATGDLAEETVDGYMIKGRKDFQVKMRGYRIEPGEIDINIMTLGGVTDSVTVKQKERLVNFFCGSAEVDTIRKYLREQLPSYMVPTIFVRLDVLPRNISGKVDRAALPEIDYAAASLPPVTENEKKLAGIWAGVLGIGLPAIGLHDNFEQLGGDSLRAALLSMEIEDVFGVTVTPSDCLRVGSIARQMDLIMHGSAGRVHVFEDDENLAPLWFVHTGNSGPEVYRTFAKQLMGKCAFSVFENHNMLFAGEHFEGIRELAARYIRYLPKTGMINLGGWSFGGIVAFEMGLQLERMGRKSKLFLVDPLMGQAVANADYKAYLESDPLFERFRAMGLIDRLEKNNAFVLDEIAAYRPADVYHGETLLFRMAEADKAADNGFAAYAQQLKIINICQTHDRALTDEASIAVIVEEITKTL